MRKRYKFSHSEFIETNTETGEKKHYMICDRCGKRCQSNSGFDISFQGGGCYGFDGAGLCRKCANKVIPKLMDFLDEQRKEMEEYRRNSKVAEPPHLFPNPGDDFYFYK